MIKFSQLSGLVTHDYHMGIYNLPISRNLYFYQQNTQQYFTLSWLKCFSLMNAILYWRAKLPFWLDSFECFSSYNLFT